MASRNVKVTPHMVIAIRQEYAEGRTQPWLARKYGIGPGQIGRIVRGEAWTQVTAGQPVVTEVEGQLKMLNFPDPSAEEIQRSLERMNRLVKEPVSQSEASPVMLDEAAAERVDDRLKAYMRLMSGAEQVADAQDGTQPIGEHIAARIEKTLKDVPTPAKAERLLNELGGLISGDSQHDSDAGSESN